jgi:transport and Golgi organization protein 2
MCTVLLRFDPDAAWPVLFAAVRDEFSDRPWDPPAEHWPDRPGLIGGRDREAGGTWLAVDPAGRSVTAVLNGRPPLPVDDPLTRGTLPLDGVPADPARYNAFHLVHATPAGVDVWTWDGTLTHRSLGPGDHVVVNQGVDVNDLPAFHAVPAVDPRPGQASREAWGAWVDVLEGGTFTGVEPRPLIVRASFDGRPYGSGSASLVALSRDRVRFDFTANPGPGARWAEVSTRRAGS